MRNGEPESRRNEERGNRSRGALRYLPLALLLLAGCETLKLQTPLVARDGDVLTEGGSGRRDHATPQTLALPLERAWHYNAEAGFGPASGLVAGGHVLLVNRTGEVHVVEARDGDRVGKVELGSGADGAPVLLDGRRLIAPLADGKYGLVAFDLVEGARAWTLRDTPHAAGLLMAGGTLVAAALDGTVRGLDPADGDVRWTVRPDSLAAFYASPVEAGPGLVVVADDRGGVAALAPATGAVRWRSALDAPVYVTPTVTTTEVADPAGGAGTLVVLPTTRGRLVALDAETGAERWTYHADDPAVRFASAASVEGVLVLGGSDGVLRALDPATGAERWAVRFDGVLAAAPLVAGPVVFVGTMGRTLAAVDLASGVRLWETELDGRIKSAPVLAAGRLVVLVEPKDVVAFAPLPVVAGRSR